MNKLQTNEGQSVSATESYGRWFPVAIACLALAPFLPLLIPDNRVIASNEYCDYATFYLPIREFASDEFRNGRFPLWTPWLGSGMPLHASQQAGLCYPLMAPLTILLPVNLAMRAALFGHLLLCFGGQYFLARALGISRAAASFAAIVPTQSGYVVSHLMAGHVNHVVAFGLTPWFFLALLRHLRRATAGSALFLAILGALLILSGHPQPVYYAALTGFFWWTGSLLAGAGAGHRMRCFGWTAVAAAVAMMLTSVQLLPTLELMRDNGGATDRGTAEFATAFALDGLDLWNFIVPNLRGNPFAGIPDFPGFYFFHERAGYVGLATWVLALLALSRSSAKRWEWGAAALIFLYLVISLGAATPVFGSLVKILPGFSYFRCPGRILSIVSILAGLLAGKGLDATVSGKEPSRNWNGTLLLIAIVVVANGAAYLMMNDTTSFSWSAYRDFVRSYLMTDLVVSAALAAGSGLALWLSLRFGRVMPRRTLAAMLALLLADLGFNNAANFRLHEPLTDTIPQDVLDREPAIRFVEVRQPGLLSASDVRYSKSVPLAITHHRGMLGSNDGGVVPGAVERLYHALEVNTAAALAVSACEYEYFPSTKSWLHVAGGLPRCRFIPDDHAHVLGQALAKVNVQDLSAITNSTAVRPQIVSETPQRIAIELDSPVSGQLVLADAFYPGWECTVDGKGAVVESAHGVFRRVDVGKGWHRVEFTYRPASFRWGWRISLIGVCAAAFLGSVHVLSWKNRSLAREPSPALQT